MRSIDEINCINVVEKIMLIIMDCINALTLTAPMFYIYYLVDALNSGFLAIQGIELTTFFCAQTPKFMM